VTAVTSRPGQTAATTSSAFPAGSLPVFPTTASAGRASQAIRRGVLVQPPFDRGAQATDLAEYATDRLNDLLALDAGWDGRKAQPVSDAAVTAAVEALFAVGVGLRLWPQFVPLPSGGLQLEWHAVTSVEITAERDGSLDVLMTDESDEIVLNDRFDLDSGDVDVVRHQLELMDKRLAGRF
jgi:hypothetical protein